MLLYNPAMFGPEFNFSFQASSNFLRLANSNAAAYPGTSSASLAHAFLPTALVVMVAVGVVPR